MSAAPLNDIISNVRLFLESLPDQDAAISAVVEFKVIPDSEADFLIAIRKLETATRMQNGLNWFSADKVKHLPGQPNDLSYYIIEHWKSVSEFAKNQWGSPHLVKFQTQVFGWVSKPPDLKFTYGTLAETRALSIGPYSSSRFVENYTTDGKCDGTVTDTLTGLIWFRNANFFGEVPWESALEEVGKIDSNIARYALQDDSVAHDWRLPNVNELLSLLDLTRKQGAAVPPGVFCNLEAANYWSSTSVAAFPALGWYVATAVGPQVFDLKFNKMRVWPVRGNSTKIRQTGQVRSWNSFGIEINPNGTGQDADTSANVGMPIPPARFEVNRIHDGTEDGTITDKVTGLTWLKNGSPFGTLSWDDAKHQCDQLHAGKSGFEYLRDGSRPGDWELPDINQLSSLVDYGQARPTLSDGHPFVNVNQSLVWSSTIVASAPTVARFLYVGIGSCVWDHRSVLMGVWPVRRVKGRA